MRLALSVDGRTEKEFVGGGFRKPLDGPLLAMEIGLPAMRHRCPRFHTWLTRLEALANG